MDLHEIVRFWGKIGVHDEVPVVLGLLCHIKVLGCVLPLSGLSTVERILGARVFLGRGIELCIDEVVPRRLDLEPPGEPRLTMLFFHRLGVLVAVLHLVDELVVVVERVRLHPLFLVGLVLLDIVAQADVITFVNDEGLGHQVGVGPQTCREHSLNEAELDRLSRRNQQLLQMDVEVGFCRPARVPDFADEGTNHDLVPHVVSDGLLLEMSETDVEACRIILDEQGVTPAIVVRLDAHGVVLVVQSTFTHLDDFTGDRR